MDQILNNLLSDINDISFLNEIENNVQLPLFEFAHYETFWVTKNGCKRALQYWVYCESNQDNYLNFTLKVPGLTITTRSGIMKDALDRLYVVEDKYCSDNFKKVFPLFSSAPSAFFIQTSFLLPIDYNDLSIQLNIISDDEYPKHPLQECAKFVKSSMFLEPQNANNALLFPFNFTPKLNFQGRAEGWFKVQCSLMYNNNIISLHTSDPFIFNNPRIKKMKEHRQYNCRELKFMQIAELVSDKEEYLEQHGYLLENSMELIALSSKLFPNVKNIKSKRKKMKTNQFKL